MKRTNGSSTKDASPEVQGKKARLIEAYANVKLRIAASWIAVMFLFIYVDHFALFIPGVMEDAMGGTVGSFEISQAWLVWAMALMTVPSIMIVLSLLLKAAICKWTNVVAGIAYIAVVIGNVVGETWAFYIVGSAVEIVLLIFIIGSALAWPRETSE